MIRSEDNARSQTEQRGRRYALKRCSICTGFIWLRSTLLREPQEVPEPRHTWVLCKPCHQALIVELRRSALRSPVRLRIAIGLVAAD